VGCARAVPVVCCAPAAAVEDEELEEEVDVGTSTKADALDPLFSFCPWAWTLPAESPQRIVKTKSKTTHIFRDDMIKLLVLGKIPVQVLV
jgi:hypothetical protein